MIRGELFNKIEFKVETQGPNKVVKVGLFGQEISMIGAVHEFGCEIKVTPKMRAFLHAQGLHLSPSTEKIIIPERSFLRTTMTKNKRKIKTVAMDAIRKELKKYTI